MKIRLAFALSALIVLVASSAIAGIIFVPVSGRFVDLDLATVGVRARANKITIETTDVRCLIKPCPTGRPGKRELTRVL